MLLGQIMHIISSRQNIPRNRSINNFLFLLQNTTYSDIRVFNEHILNRNDNALENIYIQSKKVLNKLNNFAKLYKWKKSVVYEIDTDLHLIPLDNYTEKHKIIILENNTRYTFRLTDLVNYWTVSLTNNEGLFSKPVHLKNPHTNIIISNNNLYNIYFKLLGSTFNIPLWIMFFFKCNMDIRDFQYIYYSFLKENTIDDFVENGNIHEKYEQILNMLHDFRKHIDYLTIAHFIGFQIKKSVCKKLQGALLHYLKSKFSCNPLVKRTSKIKTKRILTDYLQQKPYFGYRLGREIIRYVPEEDRTPPIVSLPPPPRTHPPPPPPPLPAPAGTHFTAPRPPISPSLLSLPPPINLQLGSNGLEINTPLNTSNTNNIDIIIRNTENSINVNRQIPNPFSPNSELPRTPQSHNNSENISARSAAMSNSFNLFSR